MSHSLHTQGFSTPVCLALITRNGKYFSIKPLMFTPTICAMITHRLCYGHFSIIHLDLFLFLLPFKPKTILSYPCYILVAFDMALVIHLESNGCQDLLSHDDAIEDLKRQGWDYFLKIFEGYNLQVEKVFAQTFRWLQNENWGYTVRVDQGFVSEAIGLPSIGEKWFKNSRIEGVPWSLFMTSKKSTVAKKVFPSP
jgi:hypothetical protein